MPAITLAFAQDKFEKASAAYEKALEGQGYSMGSGATNRSFQRQQIYSLLQQMQYWENKVNVLSGRRNRVKYAIGAE